MADKGGYRASEHPVDKEPLDDRIKAIKPNQLRLFSSGALRIIGTLVALGLLIYLLSRQGWAEIWLAIQSMALWRVVLALILMLISRIAITLRWYMLLHTAQMKLSFWESLKITFAGLFASNFLPTTIGGDVVRLAGAIQARSDAAASTASLIADRLVGMAGMAMVLPFAVPALLALPEFGSAKGDPNAPSTIKPLVQWASFVTPLGKWIEPLLQKITGAVARLFQSLGVWIRNPLSLLYSLGFTWIHMLCVFLILQLLLGGIADTEHTGESMPFWTIAGLYSLVYFVTLIPISVNGYGLQEISMTLIFSNLGKASLSSGLTLALIYRTLMMAASLPGVLFLSGFLSSPKLRKQSPRAKENTDAP